MYDDVTIFDIPIYLMSEVKYEDRINKQSEEYSRVWARSEKELDGYKSEYISNIKHSYPWRYNLVVGALRIAISREESIELRLYFVKEKRLRFGSKVKHMIIDSYSKDLRVKKALQCRTDQELKERLSDLIDYTIKTHVNNRSHKYYVDMEIYNNLIEHINLRNLVMEINS